MNSVDLILEIKPDDHVQDVITLLYNKKVSGAPIVDDVKSDFGKFLDRDIGFIEFSSMVLWSLEVINHLLSCVLLVFLHNLIPICLKFLVGV